MVPADLFISAEILVTYNFLTAIETSKELDLGANGTAVCI
jgi:hypothetical protein